MGASLPFLTLPDPLVTGDHGPKDHVERLSRQGSTCCIGGMHYKGGETRMSSQPVA